MHEYGKARKKIKLKSALDSESGSFTLPESPFRSAAWKAEGRRR